MASCNILAEVIIDLIPQMSLIAKPTTWGILSGIDQAIRHRYLRAAWLDRCYPSGSGKTGVALIFAAPSCLLD